MRPYKPHVPQSVGEMVEKLDWMSYHAPTFEDPSFDEMYPGRTLRVVFFEINEGLNVLRGEIGAERYRTAVEQAERMRALFEGAPNDLLDGKKLIEDMKLLLIGRVPNS